MTKYQSAFICFINLKLDNSMFEILLLLLPIRKFIEEFFSFDDNKESISQNRLNLISRSLLKDL